MDETESNSSVVAPFVMKTYQMVSDPTTNGLISWGRENNSFIVLEPLDFSRRLLPVYFKHNNFSSFVRQLNTYGFRKVDPDKWEFANEWFLRGQTHLLSKIVRKKHTNKPYSTSLIKHDDSSCEDDELFMEITKLKQEQKSLEQEVESMNRRLEATERRPQQMMTFLYKVAQDPDILPRMMLQRENNNDKKRKLLISAASNSTSSSGMAVSSSSARSEDDQDGNTNGTPISSPDGNLDVDNYCCQSEMSFPDERIRHLPLIRQEHYNYATLSSSSMVGQVAGGGSGGFAPANGDGSGGDDTNYYEGIEGWDDASPPPPYPFSLLGGGF